MTTMHAEIADGYGHDRIARFARAFKYPATPDISGRVADRLAQGLVAWRLALSPAWIAAAILVIVAGLMAVPPVRAFVFELIGIGAVRIETGLRARPLDGTPGFPPAAMAPLEAVLSERVSLTAARERTGHPLPLPAWPGDLGEPDRVYHQPLVDGWAVFMLWTAPDAPDSAQMSLAVIRTSAFLGKTSPDEIVETTVNGQRAVWTSGPHALMLPTGVNQWADARILVEANVLIWDLDGVTRRLESELGIDEMRRIAESIQ